MTMPTDITANPVDKVSVLVAAGLISGCGALMFNVMPVFVGAMADAFPFGEAQLGDIIASFNAGFTLIAIAALFWVRKLNWRVTAFAAVALSAVALAGMSFFSSFQALVVLTLTVGLGMGALYALVMAILGDSDDPDRAFGLKLGLETLPGAALLFLLPVIVVPAYGFPGVVLFMAATVLALGVAAFFLPARGVKSIGPEPPLRQQSLWLSLLALSASLAFFTGVTASWAFLELLADTRSLAAEGVGTVLAIAFVICGIGGFIAATIADRFGRIAPVVGIILVNCAGLWMLNVFTNMMEYALGSSLFLFSVNFALAYTFGLTAKVDSSGRMVVLSAAVLSIGAVIGPATAGRLVEANGYGAMLIFSAVCSLTALIIYIAVCRLDPSRNPS